MQRHGRVFGAQLHQLAQAAPAEVLGGEAAACGVEIDADQTAADAAHGVGQPQRRVAVGGAELQHRSRCGRAHEQRQQLGAVRLDVAQALQPLALSFVVSLAVAMQLLEQGCELLVHRPYRRCSSACGLTMLVGAPAAKALI